MGGGIDPLLGVVGQSLSLMVPGLIIHFVFIPVNSLGVIGVWAKLLNSLLCSQGSSHGYTTRSFFT